VIAHNGMKARLRRPLDFLVIADHAISMGAMNGIEAGVPELLNTKNGKRFATMMKKQERYAKEKNLAKSTVLSDQLMTDFIEDQALASAAYSTVWNKAIASAEKHNAPGIFTALIGYEWTPKMFYLHRVVVFKDGSDKVGKIVPFSRYDSNDPEALWSFLDGYTRETGGDVLAIPHNGNLTNGVMFALENVKGNPLSKDYAKNRSRWEPLYEVTQIKGDSETHPITSPTDEFADFETLYYPKPSPQKVTDDRRKSSYFDYENWFDDRNRKQVNADWQRPYEYARSGLKLGLEQQVKLGVNPFKFGLIGSTDSHTSLATADENNFWGKLSDAEPHQNRILGPWRPGNNAGPPGWRMNAAGYAAVWAKENTREAIFNAMKRREVYATTGPRITVRFFGGWDYVENDAFRPGIANIGYEKGVPMGGDLTRIPEGKIPAFLIRAVKDPDGANLDRVQVIKGWHDKQGELHEKIYNVALSDGRKEQSNGKVKSVGSTVDVKNASYTNSIGDPELATVWEDPDFNKNELAFYYVRVLEIPTPRWTAYDAKYFDVKNIPEEVPMITQERAYTSPIWYTP